METPKMVANSHWVSFCRAAYNFQIKMRELFMITSVSLNDPFEKARESWVKGWHVRTRKKPRGKK